jgi:DNA (cytosine-5)-methyltransferase 1
MSFDLNVFGGKSLDAYIKALDLFAGTGWGVACQRLGIKEAGVEIMPEAVATRTANGMETIYNDVWDGLKLTAEQHREAYGSYGLLIASPPCQTFSLAGKGAGRAALDEVLEAIELHAYKDADALLEFGKTHDPRTALVLTPLAYVWRDRPRLVAMEQVPTVLPVWEACAEVMREWGYEVKVDVLNAEQYGVPQIRKRAILVARRGGPVSLPTPTHSRYYSTNPTKLDPGVKKWVSMAEALGWGATDQPSHTVTAGVHGPTDRWASGGSSVRKQLDAKIGTEAWIDKPNQDVDARTTYAQRFDVADVAAIQTYPTGRGLTDRPSPTITGGGTDAGGAEPIAKFHERYTSAPGWVGPTERLTTDEAGVLQTYERPFIWCGTKTKKFLQIGNAVPPLFAEHILAALLGIKVTA